MTKTREKNQYMKFRPYYTMHIIVWFDLVKHTTLKFLR
jgi:hypothetical protein